MDFLAGHPYSHAHVPSRDSRAASKRTHAQSRAALLRRHASRHAPLYDLTDPGSNTAVIALARPLAGHPGFVPRTTGASARLTLFACENLQTH